MNLYRRSGLIFGLVAVAFALSTFTWSAPQASANTSSTVTLKNLHSGLCLDVYKASTANEANVQQYSCTGGTNQQWQAVLIQATSQYWYYEFVNVDSGKCLDVYHASLSDEANVQQYTCTGGTNQQWWAHAGPGYDCTTTPWVCQTDVTWVNRNSGKCLDVYNASLAAGANVQQYTCLPHEPNDHQLWIDTPVG